MVEENKIKRVVSMTGAYVFRNYTVKDIQDLKGLNQLTQTLPFSPHEAGAAEVAGIDMINARYDFFHPENAINIRNSASKTFMSFVIPLLSVPTKDDVMRHSFRAMELGADGVIFQGSLDNIEMLAKAGVPVQGHIGLVPRKSTWTGGLKAVGKTVEEAKNLYIEMKSLEDAGAWAVECEVIPSKIMTELSKRTSLITVSIGSGGGGDVQFLFAEDILGDTEGPFPRHSKQYSNLYKIRQKMQKMRVDAFKEYIKEVKTKKFPSSEFEVDIKNEIIDQFRNEIDKI